MGQANLILSKKEADTPVLYIGDPRVEFEKFIKISGWKLVPFDQYYLLSRGNKDFDPDNGEILLNGTIVQNNSIVMHKGQEHIVFFNSMYRRLFLFRAGSEFGKNSYQQTDPGEDWARITSCLFTCSRGCSSSTTSQVLTDELSISRRS